MIGKTLLRTLPLFTALVLILAQPGTTGSSQGDPTEKERKLLQGDWQALVVFFEGLELDLKTDKMTFSIKGDTISMKQTEVLGEASFTIDPSKSPRAIDFKRKKAFLGIYELKDDSLKICVCGPDKGRPKDFTSTPANSQSLAVLRRIAK